MSAPRSIIAAQGCARAAAADDVQATGGVALAAIEIGASEDTVRRWIAGTAGTWTLDAAVAIAAAARARTGRCALAEVFAGIQSPEVETTHRGEQADACALLLLAELAEATAEDGRAMADGHLDADEARRLLARLDRLDRAVPAAKAAIRDKLKRGLA
jgi:hypothetical protein